MKTSLAVLLSLLLVPIAFAADSEKRSEAELRKAQAEVLAQGEKRVKALLTKDWRALQEILHDDFVQTTSYGELRKKSHFVNGLKTGELSYEVINNDDLVVRIINDTAIVTGRAVRKGREGDRDLSGLFRFTRTWVKMNGQWKLVAQQNTKYTEKADKD